MRVFKVSRTSQLPYNSNGKLYKMMLRALQDEIVWASKLDHVCAMTVRTEYDKILIKPCNSVKILKIIFSESNLYRPSTAQKEFNGIVFYDMKNKSRCRVGSRAAAGEIFRDARHFRTGFFLPFRTPCATGNMLIDFSVFMFIIYIILVSKNILGSINIENGRRICFSATFSQIIIIIEKKNIFFSIS